MDTTDKDATGGAPSERADDVTRGQGSREPRASGSQVPSTPTSPGRCQCGHAWSSHNTLGYCRVTSKRRGDCMCGHAGWSFATGKEAVSG